MKKTRDVPFDFDSESLKKNNFTVAFKTTI